MSDFICYHGIGLFFLRFAGRFNAEMVTGLIRAMAHELTVQETQHNFREAVNK